MCGTCHDVSNPAFSNDGSGNYPPNTLNEASPSLDPADAYPVERTYSEWLNSDYNTPQGVFAPQFGGNKSFVSTCQDCHMRDVTGAGCNPSFFPEAPIRDDLPLHDMTGGNTWVPTLIRLLYPGEVSQAAADSVVARARYMLQLGGLDMNDEHETTADTAFLMEQIELREEMDQCRSCQDPMRCCDHVTGKLDQRSREYAAAFESLYEQGKFEEARQISKKMQFVARILDQIDDYQFELEEQLRQKKVQLVVDDSARQWLAENGYDPLMGARPMARVIQDEIKQVLADELLFGELTNGGRVKIDIRDDKLHCKVVKDNKQKERASVN